MLILGNILTKYVSLETRDWRVIKINKWTRECLDMAWRDDTYSDTRRVKLIPSFKSVQDSGPY